MPALRPLSFAAVTASAAFLDQPLVFVDLETTGATATADRITEVGLIEVDGDSAREWSSLVNPGTRISEFIERLTGISNAMVAGAPGFAAIADEVAARLAGRIFIAHNARFDYGFLKNEFKRAGIDFRAPVLCTVKLSRKLFPQHAKHNLDSLIARHGLSVSARHRALGDAQVVHQFWQILRREFDPEVLEAAVRELSGRPSLPPQLDPAILDTLPEGPGVYLFYGENDLPLYVGKSRTLRKRVLAHFAADHASAKEMQITQQVRRIECIETAGELGALLREAALVKQLQPIHNRQLRRNSELCAWHLVEQRPGEWRPQLLKADEVGFGGVPHLYGPYRTRKEAQNTLTDLAREHGLCHGLLGLEKLRPGQPCFAHQIKQCKGVCVGREPPSFHSARLMAALGPQRMADWPCDGPAFIREGDEVHLLAAWRHLGTARSEAELAALCDAPLPAFDRDIYKILVAAQARLTPLAPPR